MDVGGMIKAMRAAGCTDTQILDAVQVMDDERRAKVRARVAKHRNSKRNGNVTGVTAVTSPPAHIENGGARVVDNPSRLEIKEGKKEKSRAPASPTPRDKLVPVLDAEHVEAVLEYRKGFKGKFTAYAASLLAAEFAKCPDPNAAADEMIRRNWQGFKAEWMKGQQRGHDPPGNNHGLTRHERRMQAWQELDDEISETPSDQRVVRSIPFTGTDG